MLHREVTLRKITQRRITQNKMNTRFAYMQIKNLQKCFVLGVPALFGQIRTIAYHSW